jgi:hypothetical protein
MGFERIYVRGHLFTGPVPRAKDSLTVQTLAFQEVLWEGRVFIVDRQVGSLAPRN